MNKTLSPLLIFLANCALTPVVYGTTPLKPYPQHTTYTEGSIKPNSDTQLQMDEEVAHKWDLWKTSYLLPAPPGSGKYYVKFNKKGETVSEAHGYGMMLCVYMAGLDPMAKTYFDGLYKYYTEHRSSINPNLMASKQNSDFITEEGDDDSATDGDLDIAFALLLADKQWGSNGSISYLNEAKKIINAIKQSDVNHEAWTLKLGDWSDDEDEYYLATRTSDFMPDHLRVFKAATGDQDWQKVINKSYDLINTMQTYNNNTGLLPDFIAYDENDDSYVPAPPEFDLEGPYDGKYYYNACRTPWRITTDYLMSGNTSALNQLTALNSWVRTKTNNNVSKIDSGYSLNGVVIPGYNYDSAAFITPFGVSAMISSQNQNWLNAIWKYAKDNPPEGYYEDSIQLFSMLIMSGNWWEPSY